MLVAIIAAPGLLGSQEAIRQSQSKEKREEHRARRCNLIATCVKSSQRSREINGRPIVLRNGKLWIDTGTEDGEPLGHMYAGYYLPYPDEKYEGLVTTITDAAPIMNWVYIDRETHEVKYGVRLDAQPNLTGPFDCTRQDRRLTFDGWEGFCAVEQAPGLWGLYFDVDDDGLRGKVVPGTRVLEVELSRKEKRFQRDMDARQQDQTTKRKVDPKEEAPVDEALGPEALVERPGVVGERAETGGEGLAPEVRVEEEEPKPFRIPKSIFENPPPVIEGSMFERPITPPPAYEPTEGLDTQAPALAMVDDPQPSVLDTRVQNATNLSTVASDNTAPLEEAISKPDVDISPPARKPRSQPSSPVASQPDLSSELRTTPKLIRGSKTRALAKAQMFEALAAAQKPSSSARQSSMNRGSRASSASEYSRDSQDIGKELANEITVLPTSPPTPAPLALVAPKKDQPRQLAEKAKQPNSTSPAFMRRPRTPPRQRALTDPKDPAVFGTEAPKVVGSREPIRRPSQSAIGPPASRSTSQASPRPPLQRRGTAPVQPAASRAPRASPQASARGSLASTMTTGRGNRGMTARVGGAGERGRLGRSATLQGGSRAVAGRKTTSALFREIDELVSQDVGGNGSKV